MELKLGRKGENEMAVTICNNQGALKVLEEMRSEYNLSESIMQELYDLVMDEEKCEEILEHGPYAITGDSEKAISPQLAAGSILGGCVPPPCTRTKSLKELYEEQVREHKKEVRARRIAKLKRFLMGE